MGTSEVSRKTSQLASPKPTGAAAAPITIDDEGRMIVVGTVTADDITRAIRAKAGDATLERLFLETLALRAELRRQWLSNHAEHCRDEWPHVGDCQWPPPAVLQAV